MGIPPLPRIPMPNGPLNPSGGRTVFPGYGGGTTIYPTSPFANIMGSISAFMQNYQQGQQQEKAQASQQFNEAMDMIRAGVPVDYAKVAKLAKKAGLDYLDFSSGPNPAQTAASQMSPGTPGGQAADLTMPGASVAAGQAAQSLPPTIPAPQPSGAFGRFMQGLHGGPPINSQSPGMQYLQQQGQLGQQRASMQPKQLQLMDQLMNNEQLRASLAGKLLSGGTPQDYELGSRLGLAKELSGDELFRMGRAAGIPDSQSAEAYMRMAMGVPQQQKMMLDLAEKMSPNFDDDMGKSLKYVKDIINNGSSSLQPGKTFDQWLDLRKEEAARVDGVMKRYPTLPANIAHTAANVELYGDDSSKKKMTDFLSATDKKGNAIFPTAGQVDWEKYRGEMSHQWAMFNQHAQEFSANYKLKLLDEAVKNNSQLNDTLQKVFDLFNNKAIAGDHETQMALARQLNDQLTKMGSRLTVKDITHLFSGNTPGFAFTPQGADVSEAQKFSGSEPKQPDAYFDQDMNSKLKSYFQNIMKGSIPSSPEASAGSFMADENGDQNNDNE